LIGKEDYCEKEETLLIAENITCTGKEKFLQECGGIY
jgi:hypothetical protein